MGTSDIAKDAIRAIQTAGLSKDVIDLLEKKISLLAEENTSLKAENSELRKKLDEFETKQPYSAPRPDGFDENTDNILKLFFDISDDISSERVAQQLGLSPGVVDYYFDILRERKFVRQTKAGSGFITGKEESQYGLTPAGRAYVIKNINTD